MISQTQHSNQGDAPALDAASNGGADPIRLIPDLDRPGLPQCGVPGRPHVWHLSSVFRSRAAACVVASHWPTKLSPTVHRRCEVINYTRAMEAQTRTRGPVLADRASKAPTEWPSAGRSPVSDHPRCRLVHTAEVRVEVPAEVSAAIPICDTTGTCVGEKKLLNIAHRAQQNGYYCGPATGVMVALKLGKKTSNSGGLSLNQTNMAGSGYMRTAANQVTEFWGGLRTVGLNRWLRGTDTGYYSQVGTPTTGEFRSALLFNIDDNHPMGVSTVEFRGTASYNGHNTSLDDVGHWIVADGYSQFRDVTHFKDPATSVWPATTVASFTKKTNSFVTQWGKYNGFSA